MTKPAPDEAPFERVVQAAEYRSGAIELEEGDRVKDLTNEKGKDVCGYVRESEGEFLPCMTPGSMLSGEYDLCPAHRKGGKEEMRRRGQKGAKISARVREPFYLPDYDTAEGAADALQEIAKAMAAGKLDRKLGNDLRKTVKDSIKIKESAFEERIEELEEMLEEIKDRQDQGGPSL